jgi:cellulose synthase/poly-beta-1,6-N-acetylglucosamine synthase-like glycosyltransferase
MNIIYSLLSNRYLKWATNSNIKEKHVLYCEKLLYIFTIYIVYGLISYICVYKVWNNCSNIVDLMNKSEIIKKNTNLFNRDSTFCSTYDIFYIIYIIFLLFTLMLNYALGLGYHYYRKYKCNKFLKAYDNDFNDKIIVHIPLYNEDETTIRNTINSIIKSKYNKDNLLLLIVVDGIIKNSGSYTDVIVLNNIFKNRKYIKHTNENKLRKKLHSYKDNEINIYSGKYNFDNDSDDTINYSVVVKFGTSDEILSMKPGNRGKKDSQLIIYDIVNFICEGYMDVDTANYYSLYTLVNKIQKDINDDLDDYEYMLIVDCDTEIEKNSLNYLLNHLKQNKKCIAVCGQTIVKNSNDNFITHIQAFEYFISHLLLKTFENLLYNVFVMSGCFTLLRLKIHNKALVNQNIINEYTKEANTLHTKNLADLGEDRFLTTLLLKEYPDNDISYISEAVSLTNVPNTFKVLVDQRRRWTNSLIHCLFVLFYSPPKQKLYRHIIMYYILIVEMFIIFILPIVIVIGFLNTIIGLTLQGYSLQPVIITVVIIILNLIAVVLSSELRYIKYFVQFFLGLPIFSIYIPLFSIFNMDNLKWGLTRDVEAEEVNDAEDHVEIVTN